MTTEYITESDFAGGLANYLHRVARSMMQMGHSVEVFTLSESDGEIRSHGLPVNRIREDSSLFTFLDRLTRYRFKRTLRFLARSYNVRKRMQQKQSSQAFDVMQATSCYACGLFSTFKKRAPLVTRVSSLEYIWERTYRRPLNLDQRICEWLELLALRRSDAVYAPSHLLSSILTTTKNIKTDCLRPPFSVETTTLDDTVFRKYLLGHQYLLFYGTVGFLKGCEVLAHSLPELLSKFSGLYFVFVGKAHRGPHGLTMMDYVKNQAGDFKDRVLHLDVLPHSQLYPIIKGARAVVLPSLIDNFPNTMLESMALGKVVIGTNGASFEELIDHGVSGFLVEPHNAQALSEGMEKVWKMPEKERMKIGRAAQECVKFLAPEKACMELEQYFRRVLKEN
ncbi:MAG: glycosyltransferase family 4 protein [Thermodesulfobacteriota bacterium]|nr:glycosyltransferase family 4 protein [Thermodesulfobacteriota bacterium]